MFREPPEDQAGMAMVDVSDEEDIALVVQRFCAELAEMEPEHQRRALVATAVICGIDLAADEDCDAGEED